MERNEVCDIHKELMLLGARRWKIVMQPFHTYLKQDKYSRNDALSELSEAVICLIWPLGITLNEKRS